MANYKELYNKLKKEVNDDFGTKFTKGVLSIQRLKKILIMRRITKLDIE